MMRVDVFSAKGGVGKTTVAFRLARRWMEDTKQPVLLIDADLSGTCLGDLLDASVIEGWHLQPNLIHLVCGRPEALPEELHDNLPVYELGSTHDGKPKRLDGPLSDPKRMLFCPSHAESHSRAGGHEESIDLAVLQALLGHESGGGWVGHVIDRVIRATRHRLGKQTVDDREVELLAGVVVDHGPGIGALQWSQMRAIEDELKRADKASQPPSRAAVFVTSRDLVDLASARAIDDRMKRRRDDARPLDELSKKATWVLNRLPRDWEASSLNSKPWRTTLTELFVDSGFGPSATDAWFVRSLPVFEDSAIANAYADSTLASHKGVGESDFDDVYQRVVGPMRGAHK